MFAATEAELIKKRYYDKETKALTEEARLRMIVDAEKSSIALFRRIREDFVKLLADSYHPISGKLIASRVRGYVFGAM